MNIFPCHEQGVWQCEWHADCTSNFTLLTSEIAVIIRDDQQPNAQNAIGFADVNAKFTAIDQTTSSSTAATPELPSTPFAGSSNPTSTPNTIATTASSLPDDPSSTSALARAASSTLSAGAKAGIAVGTVVGALAAGTLLCALFVHWRRTVRANGPENTSHLCGHCGCAKPELTGQPTRTEIDATEVKPEVTAQNLPWEMGDGREINRSGF